MQSPPTDASPLTELTASELATRIASGELSSVEVVEAFIARIRETHDDLNALVQPRFEAALSEAAAADQLIGNGEQLGPLHGVPITIKDCFALRGCEITLGTPGYSRGPATADSPLVARLRRAGAILLGKSNVPQAMLMHECDNPLFGRANHPDTGSRSPGGSTGGEAALVAAGASPLGLASDMGGSTRQPAAACGVFGFKPSTGRLTMLGSERAMPGMRAIAIQPGPIARSMADIELAMRVLAGEGQQANGQPHTGLTQPDETLRPWPLRRPNGVAGMRIAFWTDDGIFQPAVSIARAVREAAEQLRQLGATVVEVQPSMSRELMRIYLGIVSADGMATVRHLVSGGPIESQLKRQIRLARMPWWLRGTLIPLTQITSQRELADLLRWTGKRSVKEFWKLTIAADRYRHEFWANLAEAAGGPVEATLSPTYGLPALRHGSAVHLLTAASHAFLANLLDAPTGVVPWGRITAADEEAEVSARDRGKWNLMYRFAKQNARGSTGLPLAVEVMAPWGQDDVALGVMSALEPVQAQHASE